VETSAEHCASRQNSWPWRSRLSTCIRVNGGLFERKFCSCDFLVCFVGFNDTGFRKFVRYQHVQRTNIA